MVWIVLASMAAGALISEMYNLRMWNRYQQGRREGVRERERESASSTKNSSNITQFKI